MKFFTVHRNDERPDPDDRIVLIKEGFAWAAFFAPVLWLLYNRAWVGLPLYAAAAGALGLVYGLAGFEGDALSLILGSLALGIPFLLGAFPDPAVAIPGFLLALLCGFEANDMKRFMLARRGYRLGDLVAGHNRVEAERAYFAERSLPRASLPSSPGSGQPSVRRAGQWAEPGEPVLGLFREPDRAP